MILKSGMQLTRERGQLSASVALGGGGARGVSHIGALRAILESGFRIDRIVGTSIGSLAGSIYATNPNIADCTASTIDYLESKEFQTKQASLYGAHPTNSGSGQSGVLAWYDRIKSFLWARSLLTRLFTRRALLKANFLHQIVAALVPDIDIADCPVPMSIITVDLKSGEQIVLEQGSLRKAIVASASIPGVFPPVEWENMLLCDFGVLDSLPTAVASSFYSDVTIGVDVGPTLSPVDDCESGLHVLLRMDEIGESLIRSRSLELADVLIRPEVGQFQWFDFSQPREMIDSGLNAGRDSMESAGYFACESVARESEMSLAQQA